MSETFGNPGHNGISAKDVDGRDRQLQFIYERNSSTLYDKKIDPLPHEFSRKRRNAQKIVISIAIFDVQVITFAMAEFAKAAAKCVEKRR